MTEDEYRNVFSAVPALPTRAFQSGDMPWNASAG